jgi:CheY-like chemotaxis protein
MGKIIPSFNEMGSSGLLFNNLPQVSAMHERTSFSSSQNENVSMKLMPMILVAEDTDSNYALVSILLRKEYNLVRAMNGFEAVRLFSEVKPDLILMDIQMPEMNGLDATRLIRMVDANVPIVALTAFAFDSDRKMFFDAGGSDYISKPIDPDTLRHLVKSII